MGTPRLLPGLLFLAHCASALAWGPFTHCIVNQLSLEILSQEADAEILREGEFARLYVQAGSTADLVFQIHKGGKTDPALNRVLHEEAFHAFLYRQCKESGDLKGQVFALGLAGHLAGDHVGNTEHSATALDLFGWPQDQDIFGRPAPSPEGSAGAQLRSVSIGMGKIVLDGLMRKEKKFGRFYHPVVRQDALIRALLTYQGPHALPHASPEQQESLRNKVESFSRTFLLSFKALQKFDFRVWMNRKLRRPLATFYGGEGRDVPGILESAQAAAASVLALIRDQPSRAPDSAESLAAGASEVDPAISCLSSMSPEERNLLAQALGTDHPQEDFLPSGDSGALSEVDRKDLGRLQKKVMVRFFAGLMVPNRSWEKLQERVRSLVPFDRSAPDEELEAAEEVPPVPVIPDMQGLTEARGN